MKVILLSFLFFGVAWATLSCDCGKRNAGRIIGGKETKRNKYPWMVALQYKNTRFTYCGGTIVTPWHVLTAAHCVWYEQASDILLVVGAHDVHDLTDSTSHAVLVEQIVMHPDHNNRTMIADIALLVTSTEMIFIDRFIGPACMASGSLLDELKGQMVKATGWGKYDRNKINNDKIKYLREVDLQIVTVKDCQGANGKKICTYTLGKDTCHGDSGGPLVWLDPVTNRYTLVAIVSYGVDKCGDEGKNAISTNVTFYRDWINRNIRDTKSQAKTCYKKQIVREMRFATFLKMIVSKNVL